jgi:hypothetical protein
MRRTIWARSVIGTFTLVIASLQCCVLSGCSEIGAVGALVAGPPKVDPVYSLPPKAATVVVIDDPGGILPSKSVREIIARVSSAKLSERELAETIIDPQLASAVMSGERFGQKLSIREIGQAVKAETIVFVSVRKFADSYDQASIEPHAEFRVKVLDVPQDKRLFPAPDATEQWFTLSLSTGVKTDRNAVSSTQLAELRQVLAQSSGEAIAQLFYRHEISDKVGTRPETR